MAQFEYDMDKNDISHIRFGGFGAAGSETWVTGQKMKPYQIKKMKELLQKMEGETDKTVKPEVVENFDNMFD